ncbi:social motility and stimulation tgl protein [Cystobacter fuscus]|uniref:social motility and stimulation tgl protein n=1 Tax=Cystobacter fuscus TaxID=43 RepID=UPI002B2A753D|nr:social motility and stimulation tgl protein [Cystobacter fuscus]
MFVIDDRFRGLPAAREQVLLVHQSINSPHLAIPGKPAGPAQAFVVGLRGASGFAVFIYLFLSEARDCAVYAPSRRGTRLEETQQHEAEALAFVESMGFMMDNAHYASLSTAQQDELLKSLPVFYKDPKLAPGTRTRADEKRTASTNLGRLLASF